MHDEPKITHAMTLLRERNPAAVPFVSAALQLARAIDDFVDGDGGREPKADISDRVVTLLLLAWSDKWACENAKTLYTIIHKSFAQWLASERMDNRAVRGVLKEVSVQDIVAFALGQVMTPSELADIYVNYKYDLE